jgi:hypothetical protein
MVDTTNLFNEILTLKVRNKKLKEEVDLLKDVVEELQEAVDQLEYALGV